MTARKICVVTGTRAEYGLLHYLMKEIDADRRLTLQIIVTGAHLAPEFGLTYRDIVKDGFDIDAKIEMLLSGDTPTAVTKSVGVGLIGFADALERLQPDIMVLLGDRYEILAAATAALIANIPIAHLHGGETTEGAIDESIRHAVTKLSQLHFVSNAEHGRRVRQMGENPAHVYEVGAIGLDNIMRLKLMSRDELAAGLDFPLNDKFFVVTYHPVTVPGTVHVDALAELFAALDEFDDYQIILTKANGDAGGREINRRLEGYAAKNPGRICCRASLGQLRYLSAVKNAAAVIGNSSSGLIEAPALKTPTVNIGDRQKGRHRENSVIDCADERNAIAQAIRQAISPEFQTATAKTVMEHADGQISARIKNILCEVPLTNLCRKHFYDQV